MKKFSTAAFGAMVSVSMTLLVSGIASAQVFATATQLPTPAGMAKTSTTSNGVLSCSSDGNCLAPLIVTSKAGVDQAYVAEERSGVWSPARRLTLPTGIMSPTSSVYAADCVSPGNCVVVGTDKAGAISATETQYVWGRAVALPTLLGYASLLLTSISCTSLTNCTATGMGVSSTFSTSPVIATETNGTWEAHEVLLPSDAVSGLLIFNGIFAISCTSVGECTAVGSYTSTGGLVDFSMSQQSGVWGAITPITLPSDAELGAGDSANLSAVTCATAGNCIAAGYYPLHASIGQNHSSVPFVISAVNGVWGTAQKVQLPVGAFVATANATQSSGAGSISCTDATTCIVVGGYSLDAKGRSGSFEAQVSGGIPERATQLLVPSDAKKLASSSANAISCVAGGSCVIAGNYQSTAGTRSFETGPATQSGAPTIIKVTSKGTVLTVAFKAPLATGGLPVSTYEFSLDGGVTWKARPLGTTASPLLIPGVGKKTKFSVSIRAVTAFGPSQASQVVTFTTP